MESVALQGCLEIHRERIITKAKARERQIAEIVIGVALVETIGMLGIIWYLAD